MHISRWSHPAEPLRGSTILRDTGGNDDAVLLRILLVIAVAAIPLIVLCEAISPGLLASLAEMQ